jgi:hypothetical protein
MSFSVDFTISIEYEQAPRSRSTTDQVDGSATLCRCIFGRAVLGVVRRWLPEVEITIIGAQAYSGHELGGACARRGMRLVA